MKRLYPCFKPFLAVLAVLALLPGCADDDGAGVKPSLEVVLGEVGDDEVSVEFTLQAGADRYRYALAAPSDREAFVSGSLRGIVTADASDAGEVVFSGLQPETEYTVYAQALSLSGAKGDLAAVPVTTAEGKAKVAVEVIENAGTSMTVSFVPSGYTSSYRYALGAAADREAFENGSLGGVTTVEGPTRYEFVELVPLTGYVIFTRARDLSGEWAEVQEYPISAADAPWAFVEFTEFNSVQAVGVVRFSPICTGGNFFVCSEEKYLDYLNKGYGGDLGAMMSEYEWQPAGERDFDLMDWGYAMSGRPGESKLILGAVFWTGDRRAAGYRIYEFVAPEYDASLPVPGRPQLTVVPSDDNPQVVKVTVRSDDRAVAARMVNVWTGWLEENGEEGVRRLLDNQRFISPDQSYTHDAHLLPIEENLLLYVEPCNGNGVMGGAVYRYEYSFVEGRMIE